MIKFFSDWTKSIGVAIVLVSIIEMILPNNNSKKYIRMLLGVFVIFNIISPLVKNKDKIDLSNFNIIDYATQETSVSVNQESMDERIKELYEDELKIDIINKLDEMGYYVKSASVETEKKDNNWEITKIKLSIDNLINKKEIENFLINEYGVNEKCLKIN